MLCLYNVYNITEKHFSISIAPGAKPERVACEIYIFSNEEHGQCAQHAIVEAKQRS
jgi:hypothetical protein